MKRTLTAAAAALASSAGAVVFAGTATAAPTPPGVPGENQADKDAAQMASHITGMMHSAAEVVGKVVPADNQLAKPTGRAGGDPAGGLVPGLPGGSNPLSSLPGSDLVNSVTNALPVKTPPVQTLPAEPTGESGKIAEPRIGRQRTLRDIEPGQSGGALKPVTDAVPADVATPLKPVTDKVSDTLEEATTSDQLGLDGLGI